MFGKRFRAYMRNYPEAQKPTQNRCSKLQYSELKNMAKTMYHYSDGTKERLFKYQNMPKAELAGAVYDALGYLK